MLKAIEARGVTDIAKRALQTTGQVFRYAIAHGKATRNPAADIKPGDILPSRKKPNHARLDAKQLPELLRHIDAYQGAAVTRLAIKLMALTFVRTSELVGARWSEFDLKAARWNIPAERMKMKTPHIVPLSSQAVNILKTLQLVSGHGALVFPGERDHEKPMSNNTILGARAGLATYQGREGCDMSKLFKLRDWLTIEQACQHLTTVLGEPVERADLLRLALDGHLTLSVNFVNHAQGIRGRIVSADKVPHQKFPSDMKAAAKSRREGDYKGDWIEIPMGIPLDNGEYIKQEETVEALSGVFDLPMIGGERLDIQHEFQRLIGGPPVELTTLDGAFVSDSDGSFWQVQTSYDENEYVRGSRASGEAIVAMEVAGTISKAQAAEMFAKHEADRKKFKEENQKKRARERYFPAGGLPTDSMLVVRTDALVAFAAGLKGTATSSIEKSSPNKESAYLNIIGALLGLMLTNGPTSGPGPDT